MVSLKKGLGQQIPHVTSTQSIDDALSPSLPLNEARESQFGKVLARDGGPAPRGRGQARHIQLSAPQSPENPHPRGIREQREGGDSCGHLGRVEVVRMDGVVDRHGR